jgi:hypothetical protein
VLHKGSWEDTTQLIKVFIIAVTVIVVAMKPLVMTLSLVYSVDKCSGLVGLSIEVR